MAEPTTSVEQDTTSPDVALEALEDGALLDRVSAARRAGQADTEGVTELLRRAAASNKTALDRLAR